MSKQQPAQAKPKVDMARSAPAVSRIRRDPPPPEKPKVLRSFYSPEQEGWVVGIGVILFALAIFIISIGISEYTK